MYFSEREFLASRRLRSEGSEIYPGAAPWVFVYTA